MLEFYCCERYFLCIEREKYHYEDIILFLSQVIGNHRTIELVSFCWFFAYVIIVSEVLKKEKINSVRILGIWYNVHDLIPALEMVHWCSKISVILLRRRNFFIVQQVGFDVPEIKLSFESINRPTVSDIFQINSCPLINHNRLDFFYLGPLFYCLESLLKVIRA